MNRPMCVALDFDGVVISGSNEGYFSCYHDALEAVGVQLEESVERERIIQGWGSGHINQLQILMPEYPDKVEEAGRVWVDYVESVSFWKRVQVVPGSKEAIERMSQHASIVIVSGARKKHIQAILEREKIEGVSAVFSSYDVASSLRKPHPHTLELAMKEVGCVPAQTIYVGDMNNDVVMARAAGVEPVVVLTGNLDEAHA
ncbi:MAG: HAD-IIIA family hydrolase, partial [Candidatus Uhrbacteria bacterium]|nr:HAD-IIIA family hydrolase [Candidatus Uhrbacteria bacterium]